MHNDRLITKRKQLEHFFFHDSHAKNKFFILVITGASVMNYLHIATVWLQIAALKNKFSLSF